LPASLQAHTGTHSNDFSIDGIETPSEGTAMRKSHFLAAAARLRRGSIPSAAEPMDCKPKRFTSDLTWRKWSRAKVSLAAHFP
jgi:hypothetical protein